MDVFACAKARPRGGGAAGFAKRNPRRFALLSELASETTAGDGGAAAATGATGAAVAAGCTSCAALHSVVNDSVLSEVFMMPGAGPRVARFIVLKRFFFAGRWRATLRALWLAHVEKERSCGWKGGGGSCVAA